MKAQNLLERCAKVKPTGDGRWLACCPAHEDHTPSLAVRELPDGRILVHCFAGCGVDQVLNAVGLTFDALFPDKLIADHLPGLRAPFPAADVLEAMNFELSVIQIVAADLAAGRELSHEAKVALDEAQNLILAAREYALGKR